jgi:hypothetical protein
MEPWAFFFLLRQKKLLISPVKEKLATAVNLTYVKLTAFSLGEKVGP